MKKLSLFFKLLATGSISLMMAACYGTIRAMYGVPALLSGSVRARTTSDLPIPEIKVSYRLSGLGLPAPDTWEDLEPGRTDLEGALVYEIDGWENEMLELRLSDDDGTENGGSFAERTVTVDEDVETVILEELP